MQNKEILTKFQQGLCPSKIVLANVVEYIQHYYNDVNEIPSTKRFCRNLLTKINDDTLEVANAE